MGTWQQKLYLNVHLVVNSSSGESHGKLGLRTSYWVRADRDTFAFRSKVDAGSTEIICSERQSR